MKPLVLTPIFAALRLGLHALIVLLSGFVIVRALFASGMGEKRVAIVALAVLFLITYVVGVVKDPRHRADRDVLVRIWLGLLTIEWFALILVSSDAAYLVFALFFLYIQLLPQKWGVISVAVSAMLAIIALIRFLGFNTGVVVGPTIGAAVAIVLGLGSRALYHEAEERGRLIDELLATREELARHEREAGMLSERARLAREIHDTVAQGLSSIQMLLHAAERADGERPGIEHIRLARETAALNLAESRRFIRELTPVALEEQTLVGALQRLAASANHSEALETTSGDAAPVRDVTFQVVGDVVPLPMPVETALLRIAQGSLANIVQHASASRALLTLTYMEDSVSLDVVDNGVGFNGQAASSTVHRSFGLVAMRERVDQLGGTFTFESQPGAGTAVAVTFGVNHDSSTVGG